MDTLGVYNIHIRSYAPTDRCVCINIHLVAPLMYDITMVAIHYYVAAPRKTDLIYKKTCLYYGTYLLFCICYPKSFFTVTNLIHIHTAVQNKCIYNTAHLSI